MPAPHRAADARRRLLLPTVATAALLLLVPTACSSHDDQASRTPAASADPTHTQVTTLIATGLQQVGDQQYDAAKVSFDKVLTLDPTNVYATYNLGYLAQLDGDEATAIRKYTTTLGEDKDFAPALYNLALLTESSDLRAAVELYRREIVVKPDDAAAHMRLGFALQHLGKQAEGEEYLQQGIALDPAMADVQSPTYTS